MQEPRRRVTLNLKRGSDMSDLQTRLATRIEDKRDDLNALTQDLIRNPTLNPPGENYREICSYLGERMARSGFAVEMVRAEGAPGDCTKYPR